MDVAGGVRQEIEAILQRYRVPGATIGKVDRAGRSIDCFGIASVRSGQPVIPEMLYRMASVTKPMVATAVMMLAAEGRIDLEAPITEWFGTRGKPRWFRKVTPRHLLSHTAGIDCEVPFNLRSLGDGPSALERAIDAFDQVDQWTDAGTVMSYANTGYWLLGRILERVTGTTFENAMRQMLFQPLGMDDVCFDSDRAILYPTAVGHNLTAELPTPIRTFSYPRARRPSGGVIASAELVMSFAAWHLDRSNAVAATMRDPVIRLRQVDRESWSLGWTLRTTTDDTPISGHGGSFDGYRTQLTLIPSRDLGFAILTNCDSGNGAIREIERLLLRSSVGLTLPMPKPVQPVDVAALEGVYHQPHSTIRIASDGTELIATPVTRTLGMKEQGEAESRYRALDEMTWVATSGPQKGSRIDFIVDPHSHQVAWLRSGLRVARRQ